MNYKIVITDPYYEIAHNSKAALCFLNSLEVRSKGYKDNYKRIVYPFGVEDFVTTNVTIYANDCPAACYKFVNRKTCEKYGITFPILSTLSSESNKHFNLNTLCDYIKQREAMGEQIGYIGGFTYSPEITDKRISLELRKLVTCSLVFLKEYLVVDEILVTGIIHNGASNFIEKLGYNKFFPEPVLVDSLQAQAYILSCRKYSEQALQTALEFGSYWSEREHHTNKQLADQSVQHIRNNQIHGRDSAFPQYAQCD